MAQLHSEDYQSYLAPNKSNRKKVIIFSNSRNLVVKLGEKLELCLDSEPAFRTYSDVLTLVGTQSRAQKASTINAFINGLVVVDCNPDIAHAVSGVGKALISCSGILAVCKFYFPPFISHMSQEICRYGRNDEATPDKHMHQVTIHADSFLHLMNRQDQEIRSTDFVRLTN